MSPMLERTSDTERTVTEASTDAAAPPATPRDFHLCAFGMGGSVSATIEAAAAALRPHVARLTVTLIDLQSFHLRAPGRMKAPGCDRILRVQPSDVGYRTPTRSMTLNLAVSGGRLAHRRMIRFARAQLAELDPDVVLCCHDRFYIETAYIRAAEWLGKPTVFLQEGPFCVIGHGGANDWKLRLKFALAPWARRLGLTTGMPDYGLAGHTRLLAASADYSAAWQRRGIPPERITLTGCPRYDNLVEARERRRQQYRATTGLEAERPAEIMVLLQPFGAHGKVAPNSARAAMREVAEALNQLGAARKISLAVRQHPRASDADAAPLIDHLTIPYRQEKAEPSFPTRAADLDLTVGFYSSAILESIAIGVPAVCCMLPPQSFAEPGEAAKQMRLSELGVDMASTAAALAVAMTRKLDHSAGIRPDVKAASREIGPVDGQASERVAKALLDIGSTARQKAEGPAS